MVNPVRICAIASEVAPFAKTGGLADVTGALTKYLHAQGHDIRLFMPLYAAVDRSRFTLTPVPQLRELTLQIGAYPLPILGLHRGAARLRGPGLPHRLSAALRPRNDLLTGPR